MNNLRNGLKQMLVKNKQDLLENSLFVLRSNEAKILYKRVFHGIDWVNSEELEEVLNQTIMYERNPLFVRDELYFHLQTLYDLGEREERIRLNENFNQYELQYEQEYWKLINSRGEFQELTSFNCFEDLILKKTKVDQYVKFRRVLFNVNGWLKYFKKLTEYFCDNFFYDDELSTTTMFRFSKWINEDYRIVIEYNKKQLSKQLKEGSLTEPSYQVLIVNSSFDKKTKEYLYTTYSEAIYLGKMIHPVFRGVFGVGGVFGRLDMYKEEDGSYGHRYSTQYRELNNGEDIHLSNSKELGVYLIRYAFYSLDFKFFYAKTYLNYLEKSFLEALKN